MAQHINFRGLTDWVEVFRAGTHQDSLGRTHTFSRDQLDEIVRNVSAASPVPHVITHKAVYSPFRFGDVVAAKRAGDSLFVQSTNIEPQFERLVADGRLRDRSVQIRKTPAGLALGHVAWLGAEPPAVHGMAPVQFAAASDLVMDFAYDGARSSGLMARAFRRMREFLIDKYSVEDADRVMPEWDVQSAEELLVESRNESSDPPIFSAPAPTQAGGSMTPDEETKLKADLAAANARLAEFSTANDLLLHTQRVAEFQAVIATAIDAGRLTPAQAEGMAEFAAGLDDGDAAQFEFSAGSAKVKLSPRAWLANFVAKLGKQIEFGADKRAPGDLAVATFAAPPGFSVDAAQFELHNKVVAYRAAHSGLTYEQALAAVHVAA